MKDGKYVGNQGFFCDANDKIYVLYHKDGFYEIDPKTGKIIAISNVPVTAELNDETMCPTATVDFTSNYQL